ncbi:MAG: hypothetical protein ACJ751_20620, partial [Niastella sp.]|uniref:hypothetical protein n=1 Tax=Niastella sp. TaxID=1869183 RepID=UPI00389B0C86
MLFEMEKPGEKKPVLNDIRINDEIYDVVDWFYPRRGFVQVLQLYMGTNDIMKIMNCSYDDALTLYYEIRDYFGDRSMRILIPHFCHYAGIDELWVHLFITSLKKRISIPPSQTSAEPSDDDPFAGEERIKLAQAIENMKHGKMDNLETRRERARQWKLLNNKGEKHAKRHDNFRVVIYSD